MKTSCAALTLILMAAEHVSPSSAARTFSGTAAAIPTTRTSNGQVMHRAKTQTDGLGDEESHNLISSPSSLRSRSHSRSPNSIDAEIDSRSLSPIALGVGTRGGEAAPIISPQAKLKIGFYFALWYALNVVYNIMNKKLLNILPAPVTVGTIQLGIGGLYAITLWITRLRAAPTLNAKGKEIAFKVGAYHGSGQLFSMVSLGAGPVSFTHIVKALEPFFSAMISGLVFGKWMRPQVYATLIPVVGGVGYACLKERSFSWLAFWMAMSSNLSFALRAVVSKTGMNSYIGTNMNAVNLFAVVTIASFFLCIPAALISEKGLFWDVWAKATTGDAAVMTSQQLTKSIITSGLFHYLNNEVMYLALSNVHPVTLAVGNTMKRVFIMVASVLVFRNPVSVQAGIGSGIGISGVLLYSLTKQYYESLERKQEEAASKKGKVKGKRIRRGGN